MDAFGSGEQKIGLKSEYLLSLENEIQKKKKKNSCDVQLIYYKF